MRPSLVDIFNAMMPAKYWAEQLSQTHPEHKEAVDHFLREINQACADIRESVYGNKRISEEP